jgi:NAD+ diphosphatase
MRGGAALPWWKLSAERKNIWVYRHKKMDGKGDSGAIFIPTFGSAMHGSDTFVLGFVGDVLLVLPDHGLPPESMFEPLGPPLHSLEFGRSGGRVFEMQVWPAHTELPSGLVKAEFRKLLGLWPQALQDAACRAKQFAAWLHENRFCGACGGKMETEAESPARKCASCGFVAYPRLSPVCMVRITRGDEILLVRSPHFTQGLYSAVAGHVEAGESAEACAHREVLEEVGIEIRNLRWFGSQSWPFPHSLMLGFTAEYAGGELVLQADEIEDAQWFRRDNLPVLPHPSTIAHRLIQAWLARG